MTTLGTGPISLRGHHLICLQFLHGEGYSVEFARNILHLREQFERDGAVVTTGHDEICVACPRTEGHACMTCPDSEEHVHDLDVLAFELLEVGPGQQILAPELLDRVSAILPEWRERACSQCVWAEVCAASVNLLSRR